MGLLRDGERKRATEQERKKEEKKTTKNISIIPLINGLCAVLFFRHMSQVNQCAVHSNDLVAWKLTRINSGLLTQCDD